MEIYSERAVKSAVISALFCALFASGVFAHEIQGSILLEPPYPEIKPVKVEKKVKDSCADVRLPEGLIFNENGGVQNVIVWLEGDFKKEYAGDFAPPVLDQKGCRFDPHIVIIPAGRNFKIVNDDPVAHDIRGFDGVKMLFRFEMGAGDAPLFGKFDKPGIYLLRCGFHTWMHAIAVSAPHAYYAVSDALGKFILKDVPEGTYKLHLWHETLGEAQAGIDIRGPVENFSYTFKKH